MLGINREDIKANGSTLARASGMPALEIDFS
jgi:hypothetical protein